MNRCPRDFPRWLAWPSRCCCARRRPRRSTCRSRLHVVGNVATARSADPPTPIAELTLSFDDASGLTPASLGIRASTVDIPIPTAVAPAGPAADPAGFRASTDGHGRAPVDRRPEFPPPGRFELHTHALAYSLGSNFRVLKAPIGGQFRDITEEIAQGSVRARSRYGGFSQFLVVSDVRQSSTVVAEKIAALRTRVATCLSTEQPAFTAELDTVQKRRGTGQDYTGALAAIDLISERAQAARRPWPARRMARHARCRQPGRRVAGRRGDPEIQRRLPARLRPVSRAVPHRAAHDCALRSLHAGATDRLSAQPGRAQARSIAAGTRADRPCGVDCALRLDHPSISRAHAELASATAPGACATWAARTAASSTASGARPMRWLTALLVAPGRHVSANSLPLSAAEAAGRGLGLRRRRAQVTARTARLDGVQHLEDLLDASLRGVVELAQCERGFVLLAQGDGFACAPAWRWIAGAAAAQQFSGSVGAIGARWAVARSVVVNDIAQRCVAGLARLGRGRRTQRAGVPAAARWRSRARRGLCRSRRARDPPITTLDLELLEAFAERAALWIAARRGSDLLAGGDRRAAHGSRSSRRTRPTASIRRRMSEDAASDATATGLHAQADVATGSVLAGRFRIEAILGIGGMGVVYRATDLALDVPVALKLLRPELAHRADAFERFRQELLLARQVSSPHVVRIHDLARHEGRWLISMDFVDGESLDTGSTATARCRSTKRCASRGRSPKAWPPRTPRA